MIVTLLAIQAAPLAFTRTIELSPDAKKADELYQTLGLYENKPAKDYEDLIQRIDSATSKHPLPTGMWFDRKVTALIWLKRYPEADQAVLESMRRFKPAEFGWIENSTDPKFQEYISRPEWKAIYKQSQAEQAATLSRMTWRSVGIDPERNLTKVLSLRMRAPKNLADQLSSWNDYQRPSRRNTWILSNYRHRLQSGQVTVVPYMVYIPSKYDAKKPNPLLLFIYGGWIGATYSRSWTIGEFRSNNATFAPQNFMDKEGMIEVFPMPNRDVRPDSTEGVDCLNGILAETKSILNVDDDRCYMAGHSDGGTATYEMLRTNPSNFAAFAPLNGWPAFRYNFRNFALRPLFSYSSSEDGLYPATSMSGFLVRAKPVAPNWDATLINGFGHELTFSGAEIMPRMLDQIRPQTRNPFQKSLQIEAYPGQLTRCDWLQVTETDSALPRAGWHDELSFVAKAKQDEEPKKVIANEGHGMARAKIEGNTITVETSRVTRGRIWLHPRLLDLTKPIRLIVNGELKSDEVYKINPEHISRDFMTRFDRKALWVGYLTF